MTSGASWRSRPAWALAVRALVLVIPLAVSLLAALVATHLVRRPEYGAAVIAWWGLGLGAATAGAWVGTRVGQRLVPLATLLKLTLTFEDHTPSRLGVALRAGTIGSLRRRAERLAAAGPARTGQVEASAVEEILALAAAINRHDRATRGHCERVRALTDLIGSELGLPAEDRERLRWAALLHDCGKLLVPAEILNKRGPLDAAEQEVVRTHPAEGGRVIAPMASWLGPWGLAITQHHEKWDGTGYPLGLRERHISLAARIVAVADAYEVMTAVRSYKRAMSPAVAGLDFTDDAGSHFDPAIVRAMLNVSLGRGRAVVGATAVLGQLPTLRAALAAMLSAGPAGGALVTGAVAVAGTVLLGLQPALPAVAPLPALPATPPVVAFVPAVTLPVVAQATVTAPRVRVIPALPAPVAASPAAPAQHTSARPPAARPSHAVQPSSAAGATSLVHVTVAVDAVGASVGVVPGACVRVVIAAPVTPCR